MRTRTKQLTIAVCVLLFITGIWTRYSLGYGMYIGQSFVGVVHSQSEAQAILDILSAETNIPLFPHRLYLRFLPKANFSDPSEVLEKIKSENHIQTEFLMENEEIPFENETVEDNTLYTGEETVTREGTNGSRAVIKEVTRIGGISAKEEIVSSSILTAPISKITAIGTKERPPGVGTGVFLFPLHEISVSSGFGNRWGRQHKGIDLAADEGTPILASDNGIVSFCGPCDGYGNLIILDHQNGYTTYYAHCSALYAIVGSTPKKGETIGAVGSTGNSTGPHLHFEIRKDGEAQNPQDFFPASLF